MVGAFGAPAAYDSVRRQTAFLSFIFYNASCASNTLRRACAPVSPIVFLTENGKKAPFTGLLYELYPNGNILGYSFYKDGYEEGTNVDFYDNGRVSKYSSFDKDSNKTLIIKWFRNGQISGVTELTDHGLHKKFIEYDENGNIIRKGDV
jgi:hypothetical protein